MDAPTATEPSQTPAPTEEQPPAPQRPLQELLDEGSKSLATKQYAEATELFALALEQLTTLHGELAPETAEVLVLYGKALLRNAVASSGVLGGPTSKPAVAEAGTETSSEQTVASSSKAPATLPATTAAPGPARNFHFGGDEPEEEEEDAEAGEGEVQEATTDPDDDLETAFGVLDTAKVIYQRMEGDEAKLNLAAVHDALGEVMTESEKFEEAAQEFTAAHELLAGLLEPHDRRIAEAHMMIALALEYVTVEPEQARQRAIEHAEKAKEVLQLKMRMLKEAAKEEGKAEIKDIEEVMAELDMKIDDLKTAPVIQAQTEADKALQEALGKPTMDPSAPVNDLSTLVKKKKKPPAAATMANGESKRKAEDDVADVDSKKPRIDEASP